MDFNNDIVDYEGSDYRITEAIGLSESAFQSNNPRITDGFRGMGYPPAAYAMFRRGHSQPSTRTGSSHADSSTTSSWSGSHRYQQPEAGTHGSRELVRVNRDLQHQNERLQRENTILQTRLEAIEHVIQALAPQAISNLQPPTAHLGLPQNSPFLSGSTLPPSPFISGTTLPLTASALGLVDTPKASDNPNIQFWRRRTWAAHCKKRADTSDIRKDAGSKSLPPMMQYIEHPDGSTIDDERAKSIRRHARAIWQQFAQVSNLLPLTWGKASIAVSRQYHQEMRAKFPELAFCEDDWKAEEIATYYYPSWYKNHKKGAIKEEDDVVSQAGSKRPPSEEQSLLRPSAIKKAKHSSMAGLGAAEKIRDPMDRFTTGKIKPTSLTIPSATTLLPISPASTAILSVIADKSQSPMSPKEPIINAPSTIDVPANDFDSAPLIVITSGDNDANGSVIGMISHGDEPTPATTTSTLVTPSEASQYSPVLNNPEDDVLIVTPIGSPTLLVTDFAPFNVVVGTTLAMSAIQESQNEPTGSPCPSPSPAPFPTPTPSATAAPSASVPPLVSTPLPAVSVVTSTEVLPNGTFSPPASDNRTEQDDSSAGQSQTKSKSTLKKKSAVFRPSNHITARNLCGQDWKKDNPQGTAAEFKHYWENIPEPTKKEYDVKARQLKGITAIHMSSPFTDTHQLTTYS